MVGTRHTYICYVVVQKHIRWQICDILLVCFPEQKQREIRVRKRLVGVTNVIKAMPMPCALMSNIWKWYPPVDDIFLQLFVFCCTSYWAHELGQTLDLEGPGLHLVWAFYKSPFQNHGKNKTRLLTTRTRTT